MAKMANAGIQELLTEMRKQKDLIKDVYANSEDNLEYQDMKRLFSHTSRSLRELIPQDFIPLSEEDFAYVLKTIGCDSTKISEYVTQFKKLKKQDNANYEANNQDFLKNILAFMKMYFQDFNQFNNTRVGAASAKAEEYQNYIDTLSQEKYVELFTDFDELEKLMSTMGLSEDAKWESLADIADKNIAFYRDKIMEIIAKVEEYIKPYITDANKSYALIKAELYDINYNYEQIDDLAHLLANKLNLDYNLCYNVLSSIMLEEISVEIKNQLANDAMTMETTPLVNTLEFVLRNFKTILAPSVQTAESILASTQEFYENSLANTEEDIMSYVDMTIEDLEQAGYTYEEAIDLKTLPLIKTLTETVHKYHTVAINSEEEYMTIDTITELVNLYNNLIAKKNIKNK